MTRISFDFTKKVYREALFSIALQQAKSVFVTFGVVCMLVVGVSIYGYLLDGSADTFFSWLPLLLFLIAFYAFILLGTPYFNASNSLNKNIFQMTSIDFHDDKLILTMENGYSETVPYAHIVKAVTNNKYAIYWKNGVDVVVVPQQAFASLDDFHQQVKAVSLKLSF